MLESHRARRDYLSREIDRIHDSIGALWTLAREYWGSATLSNRRDLEENIQFVEAEVRSAVLRFCAQFGEEFTEPANRVIVELTLSLTGGPFGGDERVQDFERLREIRGSCVELRRLLLTARRARLRKVFKLGH